jgi:tRNA (guanine9-N1)-methyltransferase
MENENTNLNSSKFENKKEHLILINNEYISDKPVLPMSKNALKKMKRKEEWDSKKKELKKIKKLKKKEKKQLEQEKEEISKDLENKTISNLVNPVLMIPRKVREEQFLTNVKKGIKVIIDCDFEDLMSEKNINSMVRQISDCYSVNRHSSSPFNLILFDVGENLLIHLKKNNFEKWSGITCIIKGEYDSLKDYIHKINQNALDVDVLNKQITYLTADSTNEINDLNHNQIYIIGGIVDRNRYKFLTINKAEKLGINHGKLPIGEYIKLQSTKVLTTNHVFSILSYFNSKEKNWKEAFLSIIPKRKFD